VATLASGGAALCDSTYDRASGLPSMIQDDSIGRGVRSTVSLAVSISEFDITGLGGGI
jgi:hypothetical protein